MIVIRGVEVLIVVIMSVPSENLKFNRFAFDFFFAGLIYESPVFEELNQLILKLAHLQGYTIFNYIYAHNSYSLFISLLMGDIIQARHLFGLLLKTIM